MTPFLRVNGSSSLVTSNFSFPLRTVFYNLLNWYILLNFWKFCYFPFVKRWNYKVGFFMDCFSSTHASWILAKCIPFCILGYFSRRKWWKRRKLTRMTLRFRWLIQLMPLMSLERSLSWKTICLLPPKKSVSTHQSVCFVVQFVNLPLEFLCFLNVALLFGHNLQIVTQWNGMMIEVITERKKISSLTSHQFIR